MFKCLKILESTVSKSLEKGYRSTKSWMLFRCVQYSLTTEQIISRRLLCYDMFTFKPSNSAYFSRGLWRSSQPFYLQTVLLKESFLLRDSVHPQRKVVYSTPRHQRFGGMCCIQWIGAQWPTGGRDPSKRGKCSEHQWAIYHCWSCFVCVSLFFPV